jgi:diguanylate cyclase (GGDEF)-like protein
MNNLHQQPQRDADKVATIDSADVALLADLIEQGWAERWDDCARCYAAADELLAVCEERDHPVLTASCLRTLAWCARWKGDFLESRTYARRAIRMLGRADAPDVAAALHSVLAQVEFCLGDPARAIACSEKGLALIERTSPGESHIDLYSTQAALFRYQGQTEQAHACLEHALGIAVGRFPHDEIRVMCNLARLQAQLGDLPAARITAESACRRAPDSESYLLRGYIHELLGSVCLLQDDLPTARQHIEAGLQLALDRGDRRLECEIRGAVAAYHAASGDLARALDVARAGLRVAEQLQFRLWEIMYLEQISELHEKLGEYSQALTVFKKYHEQKKAIFNSDAELRQQRLRSTLETEIVQRESALLAEKNRQLAAESQKRRAIGRELSYAASRDALTGLLNRQAFDRKLAELLDGVGDGGEQHVLLYIDLDQFKVINDTSGYHTGDLMLQQIAALIRKRLRTSDVLARLGADEFGVLLHGCHYNAAVEVASALREAISSYRLTTEQQQQLALTACIGVVAIDDSTQSAEQALKYANAACHLAKEQGRDRVHLHAEDDPELNLRMDQMQWAVRINEALDANEFELYCQPISWLKSQPPSCSHIEVLLRLRNRNGDVAYPREFIPAAERYGLMPQVDRWVLQSTVDWLVANSHVVGDLKVAINLSGDTLSDADFFQFAATQVERLNTASVPIILEITETSAIRNIHHLKEFTDRMRALGIRFSLDDFGSGLSSFTCLRMLNVDFLKIDGSFVRDMQNDSRARAIVESINHIGQSMGLATVAEYVESEDIAQVLRDIGVDYGQGYALGPPSPLADFFGVDKLPDVAGGN